MLSCILCTLKAYIGDNINCVTGLKYKEKEEHEKKEPFRQLHKAIETFCYFQTTYTLLNVSESVCIYDSDNKLILIALKVLI